MCGLFGYLSTNPTSDRSDLNARLVASQAALHHRGPDDRGLESFPISQGNDLPPFELSLGHTRLSIIDLSSNGHQPMHSVDGRFTILFNGEIFNYCQLRQELIALGHSFITNSDTEVLLAAWMQWRNDALHRLLGMFAFVIFDRHDNSLILARDAFGIKPLYYQQDALGFSFASEIPALLCLLKDKPEINYQLAYDYLIFGSYDNTNDTFYQGIHHLLPGHWLRVDCANYRVGKAQRWWWPSIEERTDISFDDAAAELREIFLKNVSLHLRSDVSVGAALSGGVDSSAVVCAMRYLQPEMPLHAFSYVARGSSVDEEKWVDIVNAYVGTIAHKVVVEPHQIADDLDDMIRTQGEPFGGTSIYAQYRVFKTAREASIVVMLDGQGADELLAGYSGYPQGYIKSLIQRHRYLDLLRFLKCWSQWPGRGGRRALMMFASAIAPRQLRNILHQFARQDSSPAWLNRDWLLSHHVEARFPDSPAPAADGRGRRLVEQLRFALTGHGLSQLLRHGDRNSMHWSIESRVPFLTTELAEFLLRLPESYLLSPRGETKRIFRAAMRGIVPDPILDRRDKIGFQTPEHDWLRSNGTRIQEWLAEADVLPFLNGPACRAEVSQILDGKKRFRPHVWRLINYCRWAQLQRLITLTPPQG